MVYLRAFQLLPLGAILMWIIGSWTIKEAIIGVIAGFALQWAAFILLKLLEEAFFVSYPENFVPIENKENEK